ncbi:hypothetical protein [Costertonia aggregata]|uniref:Uncharacterized protein n=1 Tax=Costertonia aggregata TaxID=343403 RepID=A0A7H9APS5_9FLAO|nr:hypothetical protein [Costertonia aggregata]QLG45393.1 hypothetical protein HYG79_08545 [Costertonia aggregata]
MSDISIFNDNDLFLIGLSLLAPLGVFLILGWFFKSSGKRKIGKVFFYLGLAYILFVISIPLILILRME